MEDTILGNGHPRIAVVDANTLAAFGLKQILLSVMPMMEVDIFGTFHDLESAGPDQYVHYFVSTNIIVEHRQFFVNYCHKTIALSESDNPNSSLSGFHTICTNVPEAVLIKSILKLEQHAHAHGRNLPPMSSMMQPATLSNREIEVLSFIAQGFINKEIANQLNIGVTTVITHRKNIMEKLGLKSVSALTIYAVMHGFVDINKI
ncbi:MAG: response regulator transcription factor [Prevotella sp.]|nr:response regulator transcription factor [Prevotella sp.]